MGEIFRIIWEMAHGISGVFFAASLLINALTDVIINFASLIVPFSIMRGAKIILLFWGFIYPPYAYASGRVRFLFIRRDGERTFKELSEKDPDGYQKWVNIWILRNLLKVVPDAAFVFLICSLWYLLLICLMAICGGSFVSVSVYFVTLIYLGTAPLFAHIAFGVNNDFFDVEYYSSKRYPFEKSSKWWGRKPPSDAWFLDLYHRILEKNKFLLQNGLGSITSLDKGKISFSPFGKIWVHLEDVPKDIFQIHPLPLYFMRFFRYGALGVLCSFFGWYFFYNRHLDYSFATKEIIVLLHALGASIFGSIYFFLNMIAAWDSKIPFAGEPWAFIFLIGSIICASDACSLNKSGKNKAIMAIILYVISSMMFLDDIQGLWNASVIYRSIMEAKSAYDLASYFGIGKWLVAQVAPEIVPYLMSCIEIFHQYSGEAIFGFSVFIWLRFAVKYIIDIVLGNEANLMYEHRIPLPASIQCSDS